VQATAPQVSGYRFRPAQETAAAALVARRDTLAAFVRAGRRT
jgi:hypothetical protein